MEKVKQYQYINGYIKEKYDRINLILKAGMKEKVAARAAARGESMSEYINRLIAEDMEKES